MSGLAFGVGLVGLLARSALRFGSEYSWVGDVHEKLFRRPSCFENCKSCLGGSHSGRDTIIASPLIGYLFMHYMSI